MRYSQGNQDDVLATIFGRIGTTNKFCVEFGFDSDELTGGNGSNTARLRLEEGWSGVLFDKDHENGAINLHRELLTPDNLSSIFARYNVPPEPDYVSIDVDSIDLWLFRAMLLAGYRPCVVSVEYNPNYGLGESVTMREGETWQNGDRCYGASLAALYKVGHELFGYVLADVTPQMDAFFVRGDLWPETSLQAFEQFTNLPMHAVPAQGREAAVMVEYR
jgi:hypothetical protein